VAPEGFSRVTVFLVQPDGAWVPLYAGDVDAAGQHLLPRAWELDGARAEEHLVTVLSHAAVNATSARRALQRNTAEIWAHEFTLPVLTREETPR